MKITIFLVFLAIASSGRIPILKDSTSSTNLSNRSILIYPLRCWNMESLHHIDEILSIIHNEQGPLAFLFDLPIIISIIFFLLSHRRTQGRWKNHMFGFMLLMLILQVQSLCLSNPNCSVCNSGGCSSCINLSYFVGGGPPTCQLCSTSISSCKECNSSTNCTSCMSGFHTVLNNSECLSCASTITNCINCTRLTNSSIVFCDACMPATLFPLNNLTSNSSTCVLCSLYLTACFTCVNINTCTSCDNDTFAVSLFTKRCYPCPSLRNGCKRCNSSFCFQCQAQFEMEPDNRCLRCSDLMDGCVNCFHSSICTDCIPETYYLDILDNLCYICDFKFPYCQKCTYTQCKVCKREFYLNVYKLCVCKKGKLLGNVCNPVPGCTKANIYNHTSICKDCAAQFNFNLRTFYCDCKVGIPVRDTCTFIYGCISLYANDFDQKVCLMCDLQQNFYLTDNQCYCKDGYSLNKTSEKCEDICGDGRVFTVQCDDGNQHNGDGCSKLCKIERHFRCYNGSFNTSSRCLYLGSPFGLELFSVYKKPQSNTGVFIFTILDWIPLIEHVQEDLASINFITAQNDVIIEVKHDKGKLYITVDYFQDLEGNMAIFSIDLINFFIVSKIITVNFVMVSETSPLVIMDYPSADFLKYLEWALLAAVSLAILLLVAGSLLHKMIGLETIIVFQISYFLPYVITDSSVVLNCFKVLNYSTGYGKQLFFDQERDKYLHESNVKVELPKQFFEGMALNSIYLLGLCIAIIVSSIVMVALSKKRKKVKANSKIGIFIYHRMLFPTSMAFFSMCFFSLLSNNIRVYEWEQSTQLIEQTTSTYDQVSIYINFSMAALLSIIVMCIATLQIILSLRTKQNSLPDKLATDYHPVHLLSKNPDPIKARQTYVGLFLINMIIIMSILSGFIFHEFHNSIYVLAGLFIFSTLFFSIYKPYQQKIDTAALLFGQFVLILFSSGLSVKQYFLNNRKVLPLIYELYYCSMIAGLLLIFDILQIVRLIYNHIQKRRNQQKVSKQNKIDDDYMNQGKRSKYDRLIDRKWKVEEMERKKTSFQKERQENDELKQIKTRLRNDLSTYIRKQSQKKLSLSLNFSQY